MTYALISKLIFKDLVTPYKKEVYTVQKVSATEEEAIANQSMFEALAKLQVGKIQTNGILLSFETKVKSFEEELTIGQIQSILDVNKDMVWYSNNKTK